jgi:hypothetical protein
VILLTYLICGLVYFLARSLFWVLAFQACRRLADRYETYAPTPPDQGLVVYLVALLIWPLDALRVSYWIAKIFKQWRVVGANEKALRADTFSIGKPIVIPTDRGVFEKLDVTS